MTPKHVSGTIKACPFCGAVPRVNCDDYSSAGSGEYYIECNSADCIMPEVSDADYDALVAAWNKRAAIQPDPETKPVAWPEGFFRIPAGGDARLRECATDGCYQHVSIRVERGVIGSDYCEPCARKIADQFMPATPSSAGTVSVEAWSVETNTLPWVFLTVDQMRAFEASTGPLERLGLNGEWMPTDTPISPGLVYRVRPAALRALAGERG